jgi:hypothetical protein
MKRDIVGEENKKGFGKLLEKLGVNVCENCSSIWIFNAVQKRNHAYLSTIC